MNRPDDLNRCLQSVFQAIDLPDEVIVSDDSSSPVATQAIVDKYPTVIYQSGPQRGLSPNRNACIRHTRSNYIVFIDDDVRVPSEFIAVARKLVKVSAPGIILTGYEMNHSDEMPHPGAVRKVIPHNADFWGVQQVPVRDEYRSIVINATIFPRDLFEQVHFDEHLRYGCDEIDIARHATSLGYRILYQDDLYVHHHPSSINRERYKHYVHASRLYTTTKAYWHYEHSWLKALVYLALAPLQLAGSGLRRGDFSMVGKAIRATRIAYHYLLTQSKPQQAN